MASLSLRSVLGLFIAASASNLCGAFSPYASSPPASHSSSLSWALQASSNANGNGDGDGVAEAADPTGRRSFLGQSVALSLGALTAAQLAPGTGGPADAVGPVKINLNNPQYSAAPCPPSKPIPGEKAMKGMRGLCVTVKADLEGSPDKVRRRQHCQRDTTTTTTTTTTEISMCVAC